VRAAGKHEEFLAIACPIETFNRNRDNTICFSLYFKADSGEFAADFLELAGAAEGVLWQKRVLKAGP
jgi:hypothetical protein